MDPNTTSGPPADFEARRRRRSKRWRAIAVCAVAIGLLTAIYSFTIEPYWIEVSHYRVSAPIGTSLKIAHLTDLHTQGLGRRERKVLAILEAERPDLIVITGDTTADNGTLEMARDVLSRLRAPLGVCAVRGNWELWRPSKNERAFYESVGVKFLLNSNLQVAERVWLIGFDDAFAGHPNLEAALTGVPVDAFKIALFHTPSYFDVVAGKCDLALAGHLHGGQVRLPLIGPLWLPARGRKYLNGWYDQGGSRMYISRGVGTSILNVRFYCRPEIALITVAE